MKQFRDENHSITPQYPKVARALIDYQFSQQSTLRQSRDGHASICVCGMAAVLVACSSLNCSVDFMFFLEPTHGLYVPQNGLTITGTAFAPMLKHNIHPNMCVHINGILGLSKHAAAQKKNTIISNFWENKLNCLKTFFRNTAGKQPNFTSEFTNYTFPHN